MEIVAFLRDLVIIIFGLVWIVAGALVSIVVFMTWRFVKTLPSRAEAVTVPAHELLGQVKEAVGTAGEGARTAKETVSFISEKAVVPAIVAASAAVGARKFFEALFNGPGRNGREDTA